MHSDFREEVFKNCKLLYAQKNKSMQETCMCWGWECGEGWNDILADASYQLEALNMIVYPKYKLRIQAEQVKEKFGTLRFYYNVVCDNSRFSHTLSEMFYMIYLKLSNIDYKYIEVVDAEPYSTIETKELTKEEYVKAKYSDVKCSKATYEMKDGKYYEHVEIRHYRKFHYAPSRHKISYALMQFFKNCYAKLNRTKIKLSSSQQIVKAFLHRQAECIIAKAEKDCFNVCEQCGITIGTDYSPRCQTKGWTTYLCDECAAKSKYEYYVGDETWKKGKCIKSAIENFTDKIKHDVQHKINAKRYEAKIKERQQLIDEELTINSK